MSRFFALSVAAPESVARQYFATTREAAELRTLEYDAAVKIQSTWRGFITRVRISMLNYAVNTIQRVWRGVLGRRRANRQRIRRQMEALDRFFYRQAQLIQKTFRGYWSRKYVHNYYERKMYLQEVLRQTEKVRQDNLVHLERQIAYEEYQLEERRQREFIDLTQNLHHLISTGTVPGIFNPPHAVDGQPLAYGLPVEDHLRLASQSFARRHVLQKLNDTASVGKNRSRGGVAPSGNESIANGNNAMMDGSDANGKRVSSAPNASDLNSSGNFNGTGMGTMRSGKFSSDFNGTGTVAGGGTSRSLSEHNRQQSTSFGASNSASRKSKIPGPFLPPMELTQKLVKKTQTGVSASVPFHDHEDLIRVERRVKSLMSISGPMKFSLSGRTSGSQMANAKPVSDPFSDIPIVLREEDKSMRISEKPWKANSSMKSTLFDQTTGFVPSGPQSHLFNRQN